MYKSPTAVSHRFKLNLLPIAALLSLIAGLLVYLLARPAPPVLIQSVLTLLGVNAQSSALFSPPFAFQLPSFFHMLGLMLMAAALTRGQPRLRAIALAITFALGTAMELVQHPAVSNTVSTCTAAACSWLPWFEAYARTGTFDLLDLYAIVFAALVAFIIIALIPSGRNHDLYERN